VITRSVEIDALKLDPENARQHSEDNLIAIANSLKKFGQRKPIVVWQGFVLAGNGTLAAARSLGWKTIEVAYAPAEWSADEARAYSLADNQTATLAEWNDSDLWTQLIDLDANGYEMTDFGFDPVEFNGVTQADIHNEDDAEYETVIRFANAQDKTDFFQLIKRKVARQLWWPRKPKERAE
jgi:site-specific DNA-methyltransferase (adenine-specific)